MDVSKNTTTFLEFFVYFNFIFLWWSPQNMVIYSRTLKCSLYRFGDYFINLCDAWAVIGSKIYVFSITATSKHSKIHWSKNVWEIKKQQQIHNYNSVVWAHVIIQNATIEKDPFIPHRLNVFSNCCRSAWTLASTRIHEILSWITCSLITLHLYLNPIWHYSKPMWANEKKILFNCTTSIVRDINGAGLVVLIV